MTEGIRSSALGSAYTNNLTKNNASKEAFAKQEGARTVKNMTKVEAIKEEIASGSYTVDIDKLARKMAEELVS
jgi:anti-sigma28 factor (negative regulator of flagellin synthesis)